MNSLINQQVLDLIPEDVAERFMAVLLAEVQNRLAVAMVDASNVQAVDYLSSPLSVRSRCLWPLKRESGTCLTSIN